MRLGRQPWKAGLGPFLPLAFLAATSLAGCARTGPDLKVQPQRRRAASDIKPAARLTKTLAPGKSKAAEPAREPLEGLDRENQSPEEQARALVQRLKGSFQLDEQDPAQPGLVIDLSFTAAKDSDLGFLAALPRVHELYLINTRITDAGLAHLNQHARLRTLDLARTKVTDLGLPRLGGLPGLRILGLSGTGITDSGLVSIRQLGQLRKLDLSGTAVSEAGVRKLQGALPRLVILR
jgi:Leucine Rich repeat